MKKTSMLLVIITLLTVVVLYAQETPQEFGPTLTIGRNARLGLEASTSFAWDITNKSTGLETKVGMDLVFPLFPKADRGLAPNSPDQPSVRISIKNAAFTWWNTYDTTGGNYEQDDFNSWQARPLVLTFDDFFADVVWKNYFFRIASSSTVMRTNQSGIFSIFDDVMDAGDRWYIRRSATRALWTRERYNIQQFPLLKQKIVRDFIDDDYRPRISGILALGAEFNWFSGAIKAASHANGLDNNNNAWLFGLDAEFVPVENFLITLTGFAGINYDTTNIGKNPLSIGASLEYRFDLSERFILTPKAGFDFSMDTASGTAAWELSAGVLLNTRGYDYITSSRILDWDNVIPAGASLSFNISDASEMGIMLSWFEPADRDSMIPYFGGFLQLELANLLGVTTSERGNTIAFGVLAQLEYMIAEKFTPYIRGGYVPEFQQNSAALTTDNYLIKAALGCYITPVHFFSIDVRFAMDAQLRTDGADIQRSVLSTMFTVRM